MSGTRDLELLSELFDRPVDRIKQEISARDGMFVGNREHYFQLGQSALQCIKLAILAAHKEPQQVQSILDLPSGYGRVLRTLRAAFSEASITACDIDADAVDYCAETFQAIPAYSSKNVEDISIEGKHDLIWCGSLLTHFDEPGWLDFLGLFDSLLNPGGLLLITVHGRAVVRRMERGLNYGLTPRDLERVSEDFQQKGFGFANYARQEEYGISVSQPWWCLSLLGRFPGLRVLFYLERGWDDHQDVIACVKDAWEPPFFAAPGSH